MRLEAGAYSSKGSVRAHNEDCFLLARETGGCGTVDACASLSGNAESPCLFFVADGMGGHAAGDIASAFVVDNLSTILKPCEKIDADFLEETVKGIHAKLVAEGNMQGTPNMGSTLAGLILQTENPGFCNVGDSRVYRMRGGLIQQLSHDDSLSSLVPGVAKNIITNALGAGLAAITVECRFSEFMAVDGDMFLICSDGVHGFITDDDLEQMLSVDKDPKHISESIVKKAIENNSDDNCTAVVVKIINMGDSNVQ